MSMTAAKATPNLPRRRALRLLLGLNAASDAAIGAFAAITPRAFYRHVVGVDLLGPYNEHLLRDVGSFYVAFGLLFAWAATTLGRELVRATCAAAIFTNLVHFTYHAAHLEHFSVGEAFAQTTLLAIGLALPILALLASRPDHTDP
jgi:hypothetical protein